MADNSGGGKGLYLIVGGLVVAVAVLAYFLFLAPSNEPDLAIDLDDGIKIETN